MVIAGEANTLRETIGYRCYLVEVGTAGDADVHSSVMMAGMKVNRGACFRDGDGRFDKGMTEGSDATISLFPKAEGIEGGLVVKRQSVYG